jgi:hypothetical protein
MTLLSVEESRLVFQGSDRKNYPKPEHEQVTEPTMIRTVNHAAQDVNPSYPLVEDSRLVFQASEHDFAAESTQTLVACRRHQAERESLTSQVI